MRIQLNTTSYDGCDLIGQVSRSSSNLPGLTTLNVSLELPTNIVLPKTPQLISCTLSEDTGNPIKFFTGWYLGASAKPVNNNESFLWTFKVVDVLYYLANSKSVNSYSNSTTLQGHAEDLAALAERPAIPGAFRYLDIDVVPSDTDPFSFVIENNSLNLQAIITELAKISGYEVAVRELLWTDHATLFASTGAITALVFRQPGTTQELAPIMEINFDPSDANFCDFPFTDFAFGFETEGITSVEVLGKGGAKAREDGETIETSYSKMFFFPVPKPLTDSNIDEFEVPIVLNNDINKVNQVLLIKDTNDTTQLEVIFPYDPNTPLTAGQCYFDKEGNPPSIRLSQEDLTALTQDAYLGVLLNFQFIKVVEHDAGSTTALSTSTHGAFNHAYRTVKDESIADFPSATSIAQSTLLEAKKGNFFCSGKRLTTTENWINGQVMRVQIPSQSVDKWVKVVSSNATVKNKIFDSGSNQYRDEIDYSLSFAEVDKNIFSRSFGTSLGRSASSGNSAGFPVYDEIPFGTTETGCNVGISTTVGTNYTYGGSSLSGLPSLQVPDAITDAGTVTKSWTISNADNEISTVLSYVTFIGDPTTNGILEIKVDGSTLTTISIDGTINNIVFDIDLTGYPGTDIPIEAILSISSQAELLSIAEAHIAVACCRMATIAGNPNNFIGSNRIFGDGGDARAAGINIPTAITTDVDNNLYIAHEGQASSNSSDLIRKVNASDNIINTLVGGSATYPPVDGGSPTDYQFKYIGGIAQYNDEIYFIDSFPNYVWKTDLAGLALTLVYEDPAGNGSSAFYVGLAIDPTNGDLFIADQGNHIILKLANGATSTTIYAGTSGSSGFSGDGGAATSAQLSLSATPIGLNTDSNGNLYICDTGNQRIRKVTKVTGIITTIAGNPSASFGGDYRNSTDTYIDPNGVAISSSGEMVFFDQAYKVIRKITNDNKLRSIAGYVLIHNTDSTTFDGELQPGSPGFYGDGHASTFAAIGSVGANLIYDQNGEIVFVDPENYAIRKLVCTTLVTCPSITVSKISTSGDVTNASENQIDITGGNSNDPATSTSGSATYEIDLRSPDFIGHSVTATFVYSFTMQSVSTSTTANINNTITIDGDTVLSVVASNPFTAPGSGSENGTKTVDLTKYLGKIVTVVITIDQFFDTSASGVTIGFSLDTTLSC